jgi:predicted TIM-barrel fold metal-dependent hydrolase
MRRRSFLTAGLAWRAGAMAASPSIIDTHTHFYDPSRPMGVPWPRPSETVLYRTVLPSEYHDLAEPLGVAGTVVVEASPWVEDNQWVLDLARDNRFLLGLVGNLDAASHTFARQLERFHRNPLFLGIRLSGAALAKGNSALFRSNLKLIAQAGLTIDVLGGASNFADIVRLHDAEPTLRIVIDHLPFDESPEYGLLREFEKRTTVYAKVSNILRKREGQVSPDLASYRESLDNIWSIFGDDRVVYGSNWPVSNLVAPYASVLQVARAYAATRGPAGEEKYLRSNARQAYRCKERA